MALSIKNEELEALARELSQKTGENITETILLSLKERFMRINKKKSSTITLSEELLEIAKRCKKLKVKDKRTADQIIGYNNKGLPE